MGYVRADGHAGGGIFAYGEPGGGIFAKTAKMDCALKVGRFMIA